MLATANKTTAITTNPEVTSDRTIAADETSILRSNFSASDGTEHSSSDFSHDPLPKRSVVADRRRDSATSESSLEHLDLGRTPSKKLNAVTSTPNLPAAKERKINGAIALTHINSALEAKSELSSMPKSTMHALNMLAAQRHHDSDEANDYDEEDESADEADIEKCASWGESLHSGQQKLQNKRRLINRSLLDKRTSVQLEYNMDNPNSLRKKFRINRSSDESGFHEASSSTSQLLNNSSMVSATAAAAAAALTTAATTSQNLTNTKSNSSSSASSTPPHHPHHQQHQHLHHHNNGNSSPESGSSGGERGENMMKYVCPICEVVSATTHEFTNHIRSHNYSSADSENFTCRICSKVLSSASSLDRHVLVHTGERPFNCKYCHLTFTTNGNMHRHMRTHKQHPQTHHRRNSNGTKFNNSNNNNNNNNSNSNNNTNGVNLTAGKQQQQQPPQQQQQQHQLTLSNLQQLTAESIKLQSATTGLAGSSTAVLSDFGSQHNVALATTTTAMLPTNTATAGANDRQLNGKANTALNIMESYDESDGGCSTDSTNAANSSNNNQHNNNNNDLKVNNNNYKRKLSNSIKDNVAGDDDIISIEQADILKRHLNLAAKRADNSQRRLPYACPVCADNDFANSRELDNHLDSKHSDIPAKCKHCDVIFRTHHQLSLHPCTAVDIKPYANDLEEYRYPQKQRRLSETSIDHSRYQRDNDDDADDDDIDQADRGCSSPPAVAEQMKQRELLKQLYLDKLVAQNSASSLFQNPNSSEQFMLENDDIKSEPSGRDSPKDLADVQSILNMTSSSSTSNFLKNFEQSVNTPSSQYSYDKDEEEAQDAFTSEFRKMKLRGEFPCKLCTAVYPNLRALKGHNRVHLTEAGPAGPFRCNMCPYSICDKAALVRHMRTHNGDRPYECAVCNYAFTTKANCERHLRNRHAKTTREEVKRAIIYHASEDSSCDDPVKKMQMFSSPDFDDIELMPTNYHQPKDRSTPVSHLREMLQPEDSTAKPVKIAVKNLDELMSKPMPTAAASTELALDLSKKPVAVENKTQIAEKPSEIQAAALDVSLNSSKSTFPELEPPHFDAEKQRPAFIAAQQQLLSDPTQYLQQFYRNILFPQLNPFLMPQNAFMPNNLADFQKFAPLLSQMLGASGALAAPPGLQLPTAAAASSADVEKRPALKPHSDNINNAHMQHMNPLMSSIKCDPMSTGAVKSMISPSGNSLNMHRHHIAPPPPTAGTANHLPLMPNGSMKIVMKNGVLMPKQKQRRYRTERPFACEHCSARFTLRSNMERHVKQQHPQFYAQRQRSGHHVMRGRGASSAANMNGITHLQISVGPQSHYGGSQASPLGAAPSPISDQVKYAILAQQLKTRKDTDLLQQALAHGSNSVANHNFFGNASSNPNSSAFGFGAHPFSQSNGSMEDDEPKLVIDEDDEEEDDGGEEDEDDIDDFADIQDDEQQQRQYENHLAEQQQQQHQQNNENCENHQLPTTVEEVKLKSILTNSAAAQAGEQLKMSESLLEQAIKSGQHSSKAAESTTAASNNTMKSMLAQAPRVSKFLKEVASSPFKDESQDLVSVSKLVDNATNNSVSFNNYFRLSDVANHMEQSDEDGLVASGSASESNNSGAEDAASTAAQPKKKSAYSLAPNRVSCPYCQRMFPWSSSLRRHILTHTGQKPFKCSHCPLLFTTKSNCDRHLLRKHGNVESATSVYVPAEDVSEPIPLPKSVEEIERMQREREEEERRRKAAQEQKEQAERERLEKEAKEKQKHELEQQQQAFFKQLAAAQQFSQQFQAKFEAPAAAAAMSSSELPYKCHLCESSFAERVQCLDHIKCLHAQEYALLLAKGAIDEGADCAAANANEEEDKQQRAAIDDGLLKNGKYPDYSNRKVICAFCLRRFWSTEDLRRHMRTHSGERPFQCEKCLRKFTLKHSMLRHMKKHSGSHHQNGGVHSGGDNSTNGNSGSDYSDDEQSSAAPSVVMPTAANAVGLNAWEHKFQQLLYNAMSLSKLGNSSASSGGPNLLNNNNKKLKEEHFSAQQSDLIGNLLGISDQGILNKLMSSPDEAAKLLGVEK